MNEKGRKRKVENKEEGKISRQRSGREDTGERLDWLEVMMEGREVEREETQTQPTAKAPASIS